MSSPTLRIEQRYELAVGGAADAPRSGVYEPLVNPATEESRPTRRSLPSSGPANATVAPLGGGSFRLRDGRVEIFGSVVSVLTWSREADLLERINALPLGLTANIVTNDLKAELRLARATEAGFVWVNGRGGWPFGAPFGGHKQSGLGEENSLGELLSYTQTKNIIMAGLD